MRVIIVGAGKGANEILSILYATNRFEVIAIIDIDKEAKGLAVAYHSEVPIDTDWENWLDQKIDIIIDTTGNKLILNQLILQKHKDTIIIPGCVVNSLSNIVEEKETLLTEMQLEVDNQTTILNNIRDGMIVINGQGIIEFVNKSAERIVGVSKNFFEGQKIEKIIKNTRLPKVLKSQKKEVNQKLLLENGKNVITTRIPIVSKKNELVGAFALFKDITEIMKLAEENTDLKEIKTMLEAIFQSSDEAISVVDENGIGLMINPAYTRITGLSESSVIGMPATADISEGESMHLKVIETKEPVRGVPMKLGPNKRNVLVNVAPIIVDGTLKGSVGVIHDISEIHALTNELQKAKQIIRNLEAKYTFDDIIGPSSEMKLALDQAILGAKTPATVLLRGESGTGKELFAHAIHNESDRKHNKFIRVNCASITESILESELFGYEEGAFSGARPGGKKGLFEESHLGSIFLDEIGEISLSMQAKLLRVLQENEIIRVGGTEPVKLNVRIIAATNVNLEEAIKEKTFREDLYYRLNRLPIYIPSLRERLTELPELLQHLITKLNQDYGRNVSAVDESALHILKQHHWPGNIRELENVIGRAMIYMGINEERIKKEHLPDLKEIQPKTSLQTDEHFIEHDTLKTALDNYEKEYIYNVYKNNNFNKTKTAKELDISIRNLYYKMDKLQIS